MRLYFLTRNKTEFSLETVVVLAENDVSAAVLSARETNSNKEDWVVSKVVEIGRNPKVVHKYKII